MQNKARLVLEDGTEFIGKSFGAEPTKSQVGEVVFNTSMTGYQEILSDPSYCSQIVTMTYPLIGNYGINPEDFESLKPFIHGLVVREYCEYPSNWRSNKSLGQFLKEQQIPAIEGIDTRKLTKLIRQSGTMRGIIVDFATSKEEALSRMKTITIRNQVERVACKTAFHCPGAGKRITLIDCGSKKGILNALLKAGCDVTVLPYNTSAQEVRLLNPDGILISNGPGDPKDVPETIALVKELQKEFPLMGICLGNQILALANGADTHKMKFGHHGSNHPVKDVINNRVHISSQNHEYSIMESSLENTDLEVAFRNVNDGTIEGIQHNKYPAFSVQFHPEACPGPRDTNFLFDKFFDLIKAHSENKGTSVSQILAQQEENKSNFQHH